MQVGARAHTRPSPHKLRLCNTSHPLLPRNQDLDGFLAPFPSRNLGGPLMIRTLLLSTRHTCASRCNFLYKARRCLFISLGSFWVHWPVEFLSALKDLKHMSTQWPCNVPDFFFESVYSSMPSFLSLTFWSVTPTAAWSRIGRSFGFLFITTRGKILTVALTCRAPFAP